KEIATRYSGSFYERKRKTATIVASIGVSNG
ncbi:Hypothetical protein DEACI_2402, partial [Acididesulfobacillus acetoxydans]